MNLTVGFGNADMPHSPLIPNSPRENTNLRGRLKSVEFSVEPKESIDQTDVTTNDSVINMETNDSLAYQSNRAKVSSRIDQAKPMNNTSYTRSGRFKPISKKMKTMNKGKQKVVASTQASLTTIEQSSQPIQTLPMSTCSYSEHGDEFTVVKQKKKKAKIDAAPDVEVEATPASTVSTFSTSSSSTSCTNPTGQSSTSSPTSPSSVDVNTPAVQPTNDRRRQIEARSHLNFFQRIILSAWCMSGKYLGNYLMILYMTTKLMYIGVSLFQIFILSVMLGSNFAFYGIQVLDRFFR